MIALIMIGLLNFYFLSQLLILAFYIFYFIKALIALDALMLCLKKTNLRLPPLWATFTQWNFVMSLTFLILSIVFQITKEMHRENLVLKRRLCFVKNFIFTSFVFPSTVYVFAYFWFWYHFDRELMYPRYFDVCVPAFFNHSVHTAVLAPVFLEFYCKKVTLVDSKLVFRAMLIYKFTYLAQFLYQYFANGIWVYIHFHYYSWPMRIALMSMFVLSDFLILKILYCCKGFPKKLAVN